MVEDIFGRLILPSFKDRAEIGITPQNVRTLSKPLNARA
jgi:hypothetical protein